MHFIPKAGKEIKMRSSLLSRIELEATHAKELLVTIFFVRPRHKQEAIGYQINELKKDMTPLPEHCYYLLQRFDDNIDLASFLQDIKSKKCVNPN